jgi:hypothetical protein
MRWLVQTPYWSVGREVERSLVLLRRTDEPLPLTSDAIAHAHDEVVEALREVHRPSHVLLVDLREGPMRSDPAFESMLAARREALFAGFDRVAVLVRTAVGRLQVGRHAREVGTPHDVFQEESAALAFLED